MKKLFYGILASLVSFTRIPVPLTISPESFRDATWHIPLIGWLHAGILTLVWLYLPVPDDLKYFLILLLPVLLSGGMHEDGLADAADGIFGGHSRERRLQIMKDPLVGSYGVLSIVLYVLGYYLALKNIPGESMVKTLCIALPLSRLVAPLLVSALPYVRTKQEESRAIAYLGSERGNASWSILWVLPVVSLVRGDELGIGLVLGFILSGLGLGLLFRKKLGGITGDCLGAAIKVTELVLIWIVALHFPQ
ncbi:MAG: adenosylcobinamide-GDP ribazoletransferase [Proteobacteria bacterium]|nr:MAG: adenosylcobinamide-GDP ribazoletransferase [Pseudomonadota bacterium]